MRLAYAAEEENTGTMHPIEYVLLTIATIITDFGVFALVALVKSD